MRLKRLRWGIVVATMAAVAGYELVRHKVFFGTWAGSPDGSSFGLLDGCTGVLFVTVIAYIVATTVLRHQLILAEALRTENENLAALNARHEALGRELRAERDKLEAILSAVSDAIVLVAEDARVLFANPPATTAFGRVEDHTAFPHYVLGERSGEAVLEFLEDNVPTEIVGADGRQYSVARSSVRPAEGRQAAVYALTDISKAKAIDEAKNEFISTVSHELRTPLSAIKGYVDLILDGDTGPINDVQGEFLDIVQRNTDRLNDLVSDFLDISKIESGRIQLRKEPLDLATIAQHVCDTFQPQAKSKALELTLSHPDEMAIVIGDIARLTQALMNLSSNAIKYTPEGGQVHLNVGRRNGKAFVSVRDTGIGISKEDQKRLFSKFFRVDNSMTREAGGTGLGLTIAKAITELHNGTLSIASRENQGSTFTIEFPVMGPAPEHERLAVDTSLEDIPAKGARKRVLVVDDEPDLVAMVCRYLERDGYETLAATSGEKAIALAKAADPDVITLDIMMPHLDGFSVLQQLKADAATRGIPVIILSIIEDESRGRRLGAAAYIHKPINAEKLRKSVVRVLGPRALDPTEGTTILIASDPREVEPLRKELELGGYTVYVAAQKEDALRIARNADPVVAILDVSPPDLETLQLLEEIKRDPDTADIPLVVASDEDLSAYHLLGLTPGDSQFDGVESLLAEIGNIVKRRSSAEGAGAAPSER